jgi:hypothetical protein
MTSLRISFPVLFSRWQCYVTIVVVQADDDAVSYSRSTRCRSVGVSIPFRIKQHKVHRCREGERVEWGGVTDHQPERRRSPSWSRCRWREAGAVAPPVGHPTAGSATLRIGLGLGVVAARANLVSWAIGPTPLYRHCATGPTSLCWVWCPRSGRWPKGPSWPLGQPGGDQPNILPLDLNISLNFKHNFTLQSFSIPSQISA